MFKQPEPEFISIFEAYYNRVKIHKHLLLPHLLKQTNLLRLNALSLVGCVFSFSI